MIQPSHEPDALALLNARAYLQKLLPQSVEDEVGGPMTYYMVEGYLFAVCCAPTLVPPSTWLETIWNGPCPIEDSKQREASLTHLMNLYNAINHAIQNEQAFAAKSASFMAPVEKNLESNAPISQWTYGFMLGHLPNIEAWEQLEDHPAWEDDMDVVGYAGANLNIFLNRATAEDAFNELAGEFAEFEECLAYFKDHFDLALHNYSVAAQNIYRDLLAGGIGEPGADG